jgi:hypothetical protein
VRTFLESLGLRVRELPFGETVPLTADFSVTCLKDGFYDSGLLVESDDLRILNLNDCLVKTKRRVDEVLAVTGTVDVVLSQFSLAAWKGGEHNVAWRTEASQEKLATVALQVAGFEPKFVIPFASFIFFAHRRNFYLNDAVNRPGDVVRHLEDLPVEVVVMKPGDVFDGSWDATRTAEAVAFWDDLHAGLGDRRLNDYETVPLATLRENFATYAARVAENNSVWLMRLIKAASPIKALRPVVIRIDDLDVTVMVDVVAKAIEPTVAEPHLVMGSESLNFLFENTFGFDTLMVNGCFEEGSPGGFVFAGKTLAIENLNNLGIYVAPSLLFNPTVISIFLRRLWAIGRRLPGRS